jgi:hypothetical protein
MKRYVKPELNIVSFSLKDTICASPENFSSYIDSNLDDWGEPTIDPDEDIDW